MVLAEAFILGEEFIGDSPVALVLGDNIFYGSDFGNRVQKATSLQKEALFLAVLSKILGLMALSNDENENAISIEENQKIQSQHMLCQAYISLIIM